MTSTSFFEWLAQPPKGEEIVITGVSGKLPESDNIYEFRDNLFNKNDMVTADGRRGVCDHPEVVKRCGRLKVINKFDAGFFGVHHRQADNMDPMIRILLENVVESIMDAGVHPSELEGSKTGLFLGVCWSDVECETLIKTRETQSFAFTGYQKCSAARRLSYFLKLKGPSVVIDTACSSSMNALEHAFKAIRTGQCDNAIVGGCNLLQNPKNMVMFYKLGVLNDDGRCKVFDEDADGYVRSEAVVSLFLQKSKDARRIYAQVIYTKVNSDGYTTDGITFPSSRAQFDLMTEVLQDTGISPDDLSFMEAHGTGTKVGDPQEALAVYSAIAKNRREPLLIGSVKSNIGHSEPVSGLCSLMKVIVAMETGFIPPNINMNKLKMDLAGFKQGALKPVLEQVPLKESEAVIAINNFGFGGNNCHVLLRRWGKAKRAKAPVDTPQLICISGRTPEAVDQIILSFNGESDPELIALLHQLFSRDFQAHRYRGYCIMSSQRILHQKIQFYDGKPKEFTLFFGRFTKFAQTVGRLLLKFDLFRNAMSRINDISKEFDVVEKIKNGKTSDPALIAFLVQLGIAEMIKELGLRPSRIHGSRLICDYLSGSLDFEHCVLSGLQNAPTDFDSLEINPKTLTVNISDGVEAPKFLQILGSLYLHGHHAMIQKLYPTVEFPVSRGTPMISPLIKWNHELTRYTFVYEDEDAEVRQMEFAVELKDDDEYLEGHVIDGQCTVPVSLLLNLVWKALAWTKKLLPDDMPVVFESCRFYKVINLQRSEPVKFLVTFQKDNGRFEVLENSEVVATGQAFLVDGSNGNVEIQTSDEGADGGSLELTQEEIYKELNIRGYNYKGLFRGIERCNTTVSKASIKWEHNWVTFLDKMIQMRLLQLDTRLLYTPVELRRLSINPKKHLQHIQSLKCQDLLQVTSLSELNLVKTDFIEIMGLDFLSLPRKEAPNPVLGKFVFVPNESNLSLKDSAVVTTQLILENALEKQISAVELIDEYSENVKLILPLMKRAFDFIPLATPVFGISSKSRSGTVDDINIENVALGLASNLDLIVGWRLFGKPAFLRQALSYLNQGGFLLSREEKGFVPQENGISILAVHSTENENLILFSTRREKSREDFCKKISSTSFSWLKEVQVSLKTKSRVILVAQGEDYSGIMGLVKSVRKEVGGHKLRCFYMMDDAPKFNKDDEFYKKQIEKNWVINVYKGGKWGTYRHFYFDEEQKTGCEHYCLVKNRQNYDLEWIGGPLSSRSEVEESELLVSNYYASLNAMDLMLALGTIGLERIVTDRRKQGSALGFEFAGKDSRGRRVMGLTAGASTGSIIKATQNFTWAIPQQWSLEQAATVPAAYCTAIYAMILRYKIRPGSKILVNSTTDGVDIAAINIALHWHCEVFVSVKTEAKKKTLKEYFPEIPENQIATSELSVRKSIGEVGVDFVLSSASGESLLSAVRCLARGGQFFQIGEEGLIKNDSLNLLLMQKEASFHGITLNQFLYENCDKFNLHEHLQAGIAAGYVKPLPRKVFEKENVAEAFNCMTCDKNLGKVLIRLRSEDEKPVLFKAQPSFWCDKNKSYVVVGGLGGFGLQLADWLVMKGAQKLVLVSRNGVRTGYQANRIRIWKSHNVAVQVSTANVATLNGCKEVIKDAISLGPVDAIFNIAALIRDNLFEDQTDEDFETVMVPKLPVTKFLDQTTREFCPDLRYFVVFSSISSGLGTAGLSNYAMANSVMEHICEKRRRDGFHAMAIQWGPLGEVGLLTDMENGDKKTKATGLTAQPVSSCLNAMERLLERRDETIVKSVIIDEKNEQATGSVVEIISSILGIKDTKVVAAGATLPELGMDSITAIEIGQVLEKELGVFLSKADIRRLTFTELAQIETGSLSGQETVHQKSHQADNFVSNYLTRDPDVDDMPIVRLPSLVEEGAEAPTIIIFPGAEGSLTSFKVSAKNIKAQVYAMQYLEEHYKDTIRETARSAFKMIREKFDHLDFTLVGYSYGSNVSLELLGLLQNVGWKGKFIAVDGSPRYVSDTINKLFTTTSENEFQTSVLYKVLLNFVPVEVVSEAEGKIRSIQDFSGKIEFALSLLPASQGQLVDKQLLTIMYYNMRDAAFFGFQKEIIDVPAVLFKCAEPMINFPEDDYGYSKIFKNLTVITVEGDHQAIPESLELAQGINMFL